MSEKLGLTSVEFRIFFGFMCQSKHFSPGFLWFTHDCFQFSWKDWSGAPGQDGNRFGFLFLGKKEKERMSLCVEFIIPWGFSFLQQKRPPFVPRPFFCSFSIFSGKDNSIFLLFCPIFRPSHIETRISKLVRSVWDTERKVLQKWFFVTWQNIRTKEKKLSASFYVSNTIFLTE